MHPAAVTQAGPPARPLSEHVNRHPAPRSAPGLPPLRIKTRLCLRGGQLGAWWLGKGTGWPRSLSMCGGVTPRRRCGHLGPCGGVGSGVHWGATICILGVQHPEFTGWGSAKARGASTSLNTCPLTHSSARHPAFPRPPSPESEGRPRMTTDHAVGGWDWGSSHHPLHTPSRGGRGFARPLSAPPRPPRASCRCLCSVQPALSVRSPGSGLGLPVREEQELDQEEGPWEPRAYEPHSVRACGDMQENPRETS